jgi:nucleoside-diphosphate-sugar epimerase
MGNDGVFILGSTGGSGRALVESLCAVNRPVVVMHRSEEHRADFEAIGAKVIRGDAMDRDGMFAAAASAAQECNAVVDLIGGLPFTDPETWPDFVGNVNAIDAAAAAGLQRFIFVTSIGTGSSGNYVSAESFLLPLLELKTKAEEYLHQSGLDWTIIKPGGLNHGDEDVGPKNLLITENDGVRGLIDREDLAAVVFKVVQHQGDTTLGKELHAVAMKVQMLAGDAQPFEFA